MPAGGEERCAITAVNSAEPISIPLSVEELLAVLNALETPSIPGLEAETWTSLTPEQQNLALSVAHRALEARGLARIDPDGQLRVHRALLTGVGVCAFPQSTTLVEHWAPGAEANRLYGHTRNDDSVVHSVVGGVHTFDVLPSEKALVDQLAATCGWDKASSTSSLELTVPRQEFTRVCDASATGSEAEGLKILTSAIGPGEACSTLVRTLASGPRISIVQMLRSDAGDPAQEQSFTVIEGAGRTWLVAPVTDAADAPLKARTVSRSDITALLQGR